jgi:LysR family transcriptional activator of nhaA
MVYSYAQEIFTLGKELQDTLSDRPRGRPLRVTIGIADVVPKLVVRHLIEPALRIPMPVRVVCREDKPERLLAELALHELDVILTDAPASTHIKVKAFSHLLVECDMTILARPDEAARYRKDFPSSLHHAPMLLPGENTALRRSLDHWFDEHDIRPQAMGEFDDNALLNVFGQLGLGLFPAPTLFIDEVERQFLVESVGRLPEVRQQFYAVTVERRIKNPAAAAIYREAQKMMSRDAGT